jgi:penicillin-insensitive murein endopeptidase
MRAYAPLLALALGAVACKPSEAPSPRTAAEPTPTSERAAAPEDPPAVKPAPMDWSTLSSTSIRNPNDGSLVGGVPLPLEAPGLRFNPARDPASRFGTVEVIRALLDAAGRVDRELGGLPLTVNDLSLETGGPIPRHRSHQSGRDVDTLFYQLGPDGQPIESVGAFFDPEGRGVDFNDLSTPDDDVALRLDVPRTWLFVRALLENEHAEVQNIYVAEHIRTLLLRHGRTTGTPPATLEKFEAVTCQPRYPHDDHFHIRFFCTAEDIREGCRDSQPIYPWQRVRLAEAGVKPRPLAPKRPAAEAKIVTHEEAREEAREAAGALDPEVERWLDLRQKWVKKPHPGRTYCK